jgi:transcriptional regulator with XRE-family HTH domain
MPRRDKVLHAFGLNILKLREERGLTQEKLAEKADLDRTYISGIERGIRNPGLKSMAQLAKALNTPIQELVVGIQL